MPAKAPSPLSQGRAVAEAALATSATNGQCVAGTPKKPSNKKKDRRAKSAKQPISGGEPSKTKPQIVADTQERGAMHHVLTSSDASAETVSQIAKSTVARRWISRQHEQAKAMQDQCWERMHEDSMQSGAQVIHEIISNGACYGTNHHVDAQVFLVSEHTTIQCAHCSKRVHVIANVAFGGQLSRCARCLRPRCLACVDVDIETACRNACDSTIDLTVEPTKYCDKGCLFCNSNGFGEP